jgi:transcriptional regulator
MYLPQHFKEERLEILLPIVQAYPLGLLVTVEQGVPQANHLPFFYKEGVLEAHIPKVNPLYAFLKSVGPVDVLVVFQGPQSYITPSWYPTKKESGKVVPTWNYSVVHVRGKISIKEDKTWIRTHVENVTNWHEPKRGSEWQVSDAPQDFTDSMISVLCGLEISIESMVGKLKLSQNRQEVDRLAVLDQLENSVLEDDVHMAQLAKLAKSKKQ